MIETVASAMITTLQQMLLSFSPLLSPFGTILASLAGIALYMLYNFFLHPLSRIPGPVSARLGLPSFRLSSTIRQTYAWDQYSMHQKYGKAVRLGANYVSSVDEHVVREVYYRQGNSGRGIQEGDRGRAFHKTAFYTSFGKFQLA